MSFSRISLILTLLITLLSGIMITNYFFSVTREPISQIKVLKHAKLIQNLMPLAYDNDLLNDKIEVTALEDLGTNDPVPIYRARKRDQSSTEQAAGFIILPVAQNGYNGMIRLAVSIDYQGEILTVKILDHKETPGFGDVIHQDNSNWIDGFIGKTVKDLDKGGNGSGIDQISGASISSNAVTTAILKCLAFYQREKDQIWERSSIKKQ